MIWDAEKYDEVKSPQVDAGKELITMAKGKNTDSILEKAGTISGDLPNIRLRFPETLRVCSEVRKPLFEQNKIMIRGENYDRI
jgi:hypothetical protein